MVSVHELPEAIETIIRTEVQIGTEKKEKEELRDLDVLEKAGGHGARLGEGSRGGCIARLVRQGGRIAGWGGGRGRRRHVAGRAADGDERAVLPLEGDAPARGRRGFRRRPVHPPPTWLQGARGCHPHEALKSRSLSQSGTLRSGRRTASSAPVHCGGHCGNPAGGGPGCCLSNCGTVSAARYVERPESLSSLLGRGRDGRCHGPIL